MQGFPRLQKTSSGWIVVVPIFVVLISWTRSPRTELEKLVRQPWEAKNGFGPSTAATNDDIAFEKHYKIKFSRLSTGDFGKQLPSKLPKTQPVI